MAIDYPYIREVLGVFEGKGITRGYIPKKNGKIIEQSGVTIGTGVDLGQQTQAGLMNMGMPYGLLEKLIPYLGLRREQADYALKMYPLILTQEEVDTLDALVSESYIKDTERRFNQTTPHKFADRPKEVQAVAVSLEYHLGPRNASKYVTPIINGDYPKAIALLRSSTHALFKGRRNSEADMLERAMQ